MNEKAQDYETGITMNHSQDTVTPPGFQLSDIGMLLGLYISQNQREHFLKLFHSYTRAPQTLTGLNLVGQNSLIGTWFSHCSLMCDNPQRVVELFVATGYISQKELLLKSFMFPEYAMAQYLFSEGVEITESEFDSHFDIKKGQHSFLNTYKTKFFQVQTKSILQKNLSDSLPDKNSHEKKTKI